MEVFAVVVAALPVESTHQFPAVFMGTDTTQPESSLAQVAVIPIPGSPADADSAAFIWLVMVGSTKTLPAVSQTTPAVP